MEKALQQLILVCHKKVESDPAHNLSLGYRHALWAAFGVKSPDPAIITRAVRARAYLAKLCCEHVLKIWDERWPGNSLPRQILDVSDGVLQGNVPYERASKDWEQFANEMCNWTISNGYDPSFGVLGSAVYTLAVALFDEPFEPSNVDLELTENDTDEYDSAYFAAGAWSGGPPSDMRSNSERRMEFWKWYLDEAVPQASDLLGTRLTEV